MGRRRAGRIGQRIAVDIGRLRQPAAEGGVLVGGDRRVRPDRCIVEAGDGHGQRRGGKTALAVRHLVADAGRPLLAGLETVESRAGIEAVAAVSIDNEAAAGAARDHDADIAGHSADRADAEAVALRVAVIAEHTRRSAGDRRVLGRRRRIGHRDRRVVDRHHGDDGDGGRGKAGAVGHGEGKRAIARRRIVASVLVAQGLDERVDRRRRQRRAGSCRILEMQGRGAVIAEGEGDTAEGHRAGGRRAPDDVGAAVEMDHLRRAVCGRSERDIEGDDVVFRIGSRDRGVGHRHRRAALGEGCRMARARRVGIKVERRRVGHRRHRQVDLGRRGAALAVGDGVAEAHRAVEVRRRHEGQAAVGAERDRSGPACQHHPAARRHGLPVDHRDRQRIAVRLAAGATVAVIVADVEGHGRILGGDHRVVVGDRRLVGHREGEAGGRRRAAGLAVARRHHHRIDAARAALARIGRQPAGDPAGIGVVGQSRRQATDREGQRVAVDVAE